MLKSTQNEQNANLLQESSLTPLTAEFLVLKIYTKHELNNILENIEKVFRKFDQIFYREYTKNLWDEIASKNTIISLLTENINNLRHSHSQLETRYKPQEHNEAQNTKVLLDDQSFTVPRKVAKEKELRKPSYENVISPNRFEQLSSDKNENEYLAHTEKYQPFNHIDFKVTEPTIQEKISLNSNDGSIVKNLYVDNLNKNVTEQDLIELFGLQMINYLRNSCHMKLILCSKTSNSRGFAFVTGPEHVLNELLKLNGIEFQEKILVIDKAKKK